MPETWYIVSVLAVVFTITLALRALPFAALRPLRKSALVRNLSLWMPAGILVILAASTLRSEVVADAGHLMPVCVAVAVTVAAHFLGGRRTLLSVGLGTLSYVALVNLV
ncbi:branched-chain amino acid transporter permease [Arthrobacter cavernae]|uniref:AzlD domain-containing protein n=1 Tax=Arthrobacter cavernae TaxID=2817681 RepID=A0A939KLA7_9MICC|nr:AzlD domain-containing protein [Arthrobacter cavernae]MBO1269744.1 AzlD domain-containing protein [Arthrobacter cavernae]